MANNPYYNKIEYGDQVLIDLTADTVAANKMLSGTTAHSKSGAPIIGSITSKSAATYIPTTSNQTIASGQYLSGTQTIQGDANLVAGNIKRDVSIFGVTGTYEGSGGGTTSDNDVAEFARKMVDRSLTEVRAEDLMALGVTTIGPSSFQNCSYMLGVSIPSGITSIENDAFSDCFSLFSLVLPSTLNTSRGAIARRCDFLSQLVFPPGMTLGPTDFSYMTSLNSLVLPNFHRGGAGGSGLLTFEGSYNLKWIDLPEITSATIFNKAFDSYPFRDTALETLIIRCNNPAYLNIDSTTFVSSGDIDQFTETYFPTDGSFKIYVPSSALSTYQTEASNPNSPWYQYRNVIYAIPTYSELYLTVTSSTLTQTLYFQQSVVSAVTIDWGDGSATEQDSANTSVTLSHIYASAGDYVVILTCAPGQTWTPGVPSDDIGILGGGKDNGNTPALTKAILRDGFSFEDNNSNDGGAFYGCTNLEIVRFPKDIVIGTALTPVLKLPTDTFHACNSLYDFDMPNTLTSIGGDTFNGCSNLMTITLPGSCTTFGVAPFSGSGLTAMVIPYGTVNIEGFDNCAYLTCVILPDTVTTIGSAFSPGFTNCSSLANLRLPANLDLVIPHCFNGCSSLTELDFPDTFTSFAPPGISGDDLSVFDGSGITKLTFRSLVPPTIVGSTFNGLSATCNIYVPAASLNAYKTAQYWSDRAAYIQAIPE